MVRCLVFLFSDHPSKSIGSPFREADLKAVKVVNFVAMRLNLYPHTVTLMFECALHLLPPFLKSSCTYAPNLMCIQLLCAN